MPLKKTESSESPESPETPESPENPESPESPENPETPDNLVKKINKCFFILLSSRLFVSLHYLYFIIG